MKIKLALIFGGKSVEHEISIISALQAAQSLDREKYPDIVPSVSVTGQVTAEAAAQCGLCEGTPVVTGGGDGPCAAVGSGITKEGVANLSLGTSSWISFASRDPIVDDGMISFSLAMS